MPSVDERLARLEEQVAGLRQDILELARGINGPNGHSVRWRLHKLENDSSAARVAAETLKIVQQERATREHAGFTKRQQIAVLLFGAVASLGTLVSIAVAITQMSGG